MLTSKRSAECGWYSRSNIFFLNLKFNAENWRNVEVKLSKEYEKKKEMNSKSWERENRWRNWVNQKRLVTAASCDISISHKLAVVRTVVHVLRPVDAKRPDQPNEHHESLYVGPKMHITTSKQTKYFSHKDKYECNGVATSRSLLFTISCWRTSSPQNFLANNLFFSPVFRLFLSLFPSASLSLIRFFPNSPVHYFQAIDWKLHTHTHSRTEGAHANCKKWIKEMYGSCLFSTHWNNVKVYKNCLHFDHCTHLLSQTGKRAMGKSSSKVNVCGVVCARMWRADEHRGCILQSETIQLFTCIYYS